VRFKPAPSPPPPPPPPPPLPGQRVDVGGYRLYIECKGSGSPTVVFEGGQGGAGATSPLPGSITARTAVAKNTRVCSYDRAGLDASDPRPAGLAPTGDRFATELHALLVGANISGPYVLVGPSFAGLVITAFAMRYSGDTAGLVFVDADEPCPQACTYDLPEAGTFDVGAASFGSRPVAVLVAEFGTGVDGRAFAKRSTNSLLATALGSSHAILNDNPGLGAAATDLVVASVRAGTSMPPCAQSPLPAAGARCETVG
jgi:pimeloyl-ACP methyl ester carboxylesterase